MLFQNHVSLKAVSSDTAVQWLSDEALIGDPNAVAFPADWWQEQSDMLIATVLDRLQAAGYVQFSSSELGVCFLSRRMLSSTPQGADTCSLSPSTPTQSRGNSPGQVTPSSSSGAAGSAGPSGSGSLPGTPSIAVSTPSSSQSSMPGRPCVACTEGDHVKIKRVSNSACQADTQTTCSFHP